MSRMLYSGDPVGVAGKSGSHSNIVRYFLQDTKSDVTVQICLYLLFPMEWDRSRLVTGMAEGSTCSSSGLPNISGSFWFTYIKLSAGIVI